MNLENDWVELGNGFHIRKSRIDAFTHDFTGDGSVVYLASGATIDIHEKPLELQKLLGPVEEPVTRWETYPKCGGTGIDWANCVVCHGSGKVFI